MERKFKVYAEGKAVLVTDDYAKACVKEQELKEKGLRVFVWEV